MCQLPVDPGPCRAAFPRYVFNSTSGKCEMFTYGGCDGNQNNFETMEACKSSCNPNGKLTRLIVHVYVSVPTNFVE